MKPLGILLMVLIAGSACGASSDTATSAPSTSAAPTATTTLQVAATTSTAVPATPTQRDVPAAPNDQQIDFINLSKTPTSDLRSWANIASSKMADQNANILVVVYHIGKNLGPENPDLFAGKPFTPNEVLLSQVQIDGLLDQIEQWLRNDECMSNGGHRLDEQLFQYRLWLEGGADSSTQVGLCEQTRFIMMAIRESNPTWDRQRFLVHELYHAFQHDIEGDCNDIIERSGGRGEHTGVVVEGGADYFTFFVADELYTDADRVQYGFDSALNTMLQTAKKMTSEDGSNDVMGSAMATRAAALLRLMVEMGWLEHESIIDGSVFHNCARADLNDSNPNYVYARDNWFRIEEQNGEWKFSD